MSLPVLSPNQLPLEIQNRVQPGEVIHHFANLSLQSGCATLLETRNKHRKAIWNWVSQTIGIASAGASSEVQVQSDGYNEWILITNQRILFEAAVQETNLGAKQIAHRSGFIPINKVSYVGTSSLEVRQGCSGCYGVTKFHSLCVNNGGAEIQFMIPTREEAIRLQGVLNAILSQAR